MKRLAYTLCIFFISCQAQEVSKKTELKELSVQFQKSFNDLEFESLQEFFNLKMRNRNDITKLKKTFSKVKNTIGKIKTMEFLSKKGNDFSYKSYHEVGSLTIVFTLDTEDKLSTFTIDSNRLKNKNELKRTRNKTNLILPFNNEWYVFWGGKTTSQNYHNAYPHMYGHFDFWVMGENGLSHKKNAKTNEDFYAFGKDIIAPCDGKVIWIVKGIEDNIWPAMNSQQSTGNMILLETKNKEYIIFEHLKKASIVVKKGQEVKQGEKLALCGNSGLSTEPHLHFGLLNTNELNANGLFAYFEQISVNGKLKNDYLPVKGDKIKNE